MVVVKSYIISALFLSMVFAVHAETLTVDAAGGGDYAGIQEAIDAAGDGDTIIVMEGRYAGRGNSSLDFKGKRITLRSRDLKIMHVCVGRS